MRKCCLMVLLAWVLWNSSHEARGRWQPLEGFETRDECSKELYQIGIKMTEAAIKRGEKNETYVILENAIHIQSKDGSSYESFRCLPDTIDPRGPKQ